MPTFDALRPYSMLRPRRSAWPRRSRWRPGGVDVAPIALALRVYLGVSVDLAGAGHQEAGSLAPGELEQAAGALTAYRQRVERTGEIRRRRRRRGQVAHGIDLGRRKPTPTYPAARPSPAEQYVTLLPPPPPVRIATDSVKQLYMAKLFFRN